MALLSNQSVFTPLTVLEDTDLLYIRKTNTPPNNADGAIPGVALKSTVKQGLEAETNKTSNPNLITPSSTKYVSEQGLKVSLDDGYF